MWTNRIFRVVALLSVASAFLIQGGPADFWKRFMEEAERNDPKAMAKLVQREPDNAVWALTDRAQAYQVNNSPEVEAQIDKLVTAWKDAMKTNFLEKYNDELQSFDQSQWNEWRRSLGRWNGLLSTEQKRRRGELDKESLDKFVAESLEVAGIFETLGDKYLAATCYFWAGTALDPENNTKAPDGTRALEYYKKTLKYREDLDHRDTFYNDLSGRADRLAQELKRGPTERKPEKKEPGAPVKGGTELGGGEFFAKDSKWVPSPGKFLVTPLMEFERPGWNCDEYLLDWVSVGLQGKPEGKPVSSKIPFFDASKEAKFLRESDAKYSIDPGNNTTIPLKLGRPTPVEFKLPSGADYALTVGMGSNQEPIQGTAINVAGDSTFAQIFFTSAASRLVDLMGQKVRIFDDNCDGRMGSDPIEIADFGGRMQGGLPLLDSMVVGGGKRAVPYSGFVKLGPKWYRIKSDSDGSGAKFQARELDVKTGTVKLTWAGPANYRPRYIVIRETGDYAGAYFDLAGSDKGVEVPAGDYEFYYGVFRAGKGKNLQKYAVLPTAASKKIHVEPGSVTTLTMGAPFQFQFKLSQEGQEITIPGRSIEIRGSGGERYVLLSDEVPRPKVEVRKPGAKAGIEIGEMKRNERKGNDPIGILFHPADFKGKRPDPASTEIRLVEEHKWFGPIASEWKN